MAQNATIFKAVLQIADIDRDYYREHALTIARHPSETIWVADAEQSVTIEPVALKSRAAPA